MDYFYGLRLGKQIATEYSSWSVRRAIRILSSGYQHSLTPRFRRGVFAGYRQAR